MLQFLEGDTADQTLTVLRRRVCQ